jgi:hypothetical protein
VFPRIRVPIDLSDRNARSLKLALVLARDGPASDPVLRPRAESHRALTDTGGQILLHGAYRECSGGQLFFAVFAKKACMRGSTSPLPHPGH